jgi:magnesium transporter
MTTTLHYHDGAQAAEGDGARGPGGFTWHDVGPRPGPELDRLAAELDMPAEVAEVLRSDAPHRPGVDLVGDWVTLVVRPVRLLPAGGVEVGQLPVVTGPGVVVTAAGARLDDLRKLAEADPGALRSGPPAVAVAALDLVASDAVPILHELSEAADEAQEQVFLEGRESPTERIYRLSRQLHDLRKAIAPLSDAVDRLAESDGHGPDGRRARPARRMREVRSRLRHVLDWIDSLDNLLSNILQANLAQVSVRQNEDMRKISAWAAIAAAPTALAGIWGMNFRHMPELDWTFGYPLAVLLMLGVCLGLYRLFRRSGWL